ncbi:MAG: histidine kinase, partial [Candidatus Rokuibacteriota bacterium]
MAQIEALHQALAEERATRARLEAALAQAQEEQTATSAILGLISRAPSDVQPVFEAIADSAMQLFGAWSTTVFQHQDGLMRLAAARGGAPGSVPFRGELKAPHPPTDDYPPGRAVLTGAVQHVVDADTDVAWSSRFPDEARARGFRSVVAVPMLRDNDVVGAIGVTREPAGGFTPGEIELLQTFADQAVIALENARLLTELQQKNANLTEALEQQTATSEILRVISSSPTDVQPVLDAVAESAARLCRSFDCDILRLDGDRLVLAAHHGPIAGGVVGEFSLPVVRGTVGGRTVLARRTIHVADLQTEEAEFPEAVANA